MVVKSNQLKDFDAPALVQASQNHEQQLKELNDLLENIKKENEGQDSRISKLEERVLDNEKFAESFKKCLETQTIASNALVARLNNAIETNADTQKKMGAFVKDYDHHELMVNLRKSGSALFWLLIGVVAAEVIPMFFRQ